MSVIHEYLVLIILFFGIIFFRGSDGQYCPPSCVPPDCSCPRFEYPMETRDIPQMVYFGFDDAVNSVMSSLYDRLFTGKVLNPNGCPIKMSLFVSHQYTDYKRVKGFHARGMEIAVHSVSHSSIDDDEKLRKEAKQQKENLVKLAGVPDDEIVGWRSPFLKTAGNNQPKILHELGYEYDISLTYTRGTYETPKPWPFTMDNGWPYRCGVRPCPVQAREPKFWAVPVVSLMDHEGRYACSFVDGCAIRANDEKEAFDYLWKNFESYYNGSRTPFGLNMHAAWFYTRYQLKAMIRFLEKLSTLDDVYVLTVKQVLDWMKHPTPLSAIGTMHSWGCDKEKTSSNAERVKVSTSKPATKRRMTNRRQRIIRPNRTVAIPQRMGSWFRPARSRSSLLRRLRVGPSKMPPIITTFRSTTTSRTETTPAITTLFTETTPTTTLLTETTPTTTTLLRETTPTTTTWLTETMPTVTKLLTETTPSTTLVTQTTPPTTFRTETTPKSTFLNKTTPVAAKLRNQTTHTTAASTTATSKAMTSIPTKTTQLSKLTSVERTSARTTPVTSRADTTPKSKPFPRATNSTPIVTTEIPSTTTTSGVMTSTATKKDTISEQRIITSTITGKDSHTTTPKTSSTSATSKETPTTTPTTTSSTTTTAKATPKQSTITTPTTIPNEATDSSSTTTMPTTKVNHRTSTSAAGTWFTKSHTTTHLPLRPWWQPRSTTQKPLLHGTCIQGENCDLPDCYCQTEAIPGGLSYDDTPQLVYTTVDGSLNPTVYRRYRQLFRTIRNPNNCRARGTVFATGKGTYSFFMRRIVSLGAEVAMRGINEYHFSDAQQMETEIIQQKRQLRGRGIDVVKGWKTPEMQSLGDEQYRLLTEYGFEYDATLSMRIPKNGKAKPWPFTLDYGYTGKCVIPECPKLNYPGLWEVPVIAVKDYRGMFECGYVDGCMFNPPTRNETTNFLWDNFIANYKSNKAPFGIHLRTVWFSHPAYLKNIRGLIDFLKRLKQHSDVYLVSVSDVIEWMKTPTKLSDITASHPWDCNKQ